MELWHTDGCTRPARRSDYSPVLSLTTPRHTDKYAADSLLGIATVDLAELIGVSPRALGRTAAAAGGGGGGGGGNSGFAMTVRELEVAPVSPD